MHDGYLSCVVVEFLPDELRDERLDQQAAAEHGQVVSAEQQWRQQHQAAVNLPQAPALQLCIGCDDLGSQQVLGAREQDAQNKDVNEAGLHGSPETETTVRLRLCSLDWPTTTHNLRVLHSNICGVTLVLTTQAWSRDRIL